MRPAMTTSNARDHRDADCRADSSGQCEGSCVRPPTRPADCDAILKSDPKPTRARRRLSSRRAITDCRGRVLYRSISSAEPSIRWRRTRRCAPFTNCRRPRLLYRDARHRRSSPVIRMRRRMEVEARDASGKSGCILHRGRDSQRAPIAASIVHRRENSSAVCKLAITLTIEVGCHASCLRVVGERFQRGRSSVRSGTGFDLNS